MPDKDKFLFDDPFNLYDILNKRKDGGDDLKYPPCFTPSVINVEELEESVRKGKLSLNNSVCLKRVHTGGSILQLMDELVKCMTRSSNKELFTPFKEPGREFRSSRKLLKTEVILFYNRFNVQTRQILDSKGAIPSKTTVDVKVAIQNANEKVCAAQVGCEQCKGPYYTKDCPLKEYGKTLKEAYYTQFGGPFQRGGYRAVAPGLYQRNNANPSYQERRQSMEETLSKFISGSVKRHEENSNMIKEIRALSDAIVRNQGASIKTLEIQIRQISKVLQERGFRSLASSTKANPRDHVKSISTTSEADSNLICRIGSPQYTISTPQNKRFMFESRQTTIPFLSPSRIDKSISQKEKDPGSFTLPCYINNVCFDNALVDLRASVSVMPLSTYLNLGLGELALTKLIVEIVNRTVKYPKGITKNVLVDIGKFVFPVDFIILDIPEDVKVPLILGISFLYTAHAKIDVFKRKITLRVGDEKIIFKSVKPASNLMKRVYMLSLRERMKLDLEARLRFQALENMDGYRDQDMVDIILGEPFYKVSCVEAKRFDGLITIYNGSDNVTYQMARSHPRFLNTDLAAKKLTKLVKYRSSGILCTKNAKKISYKAKISIQSKLSDINKILDQGGSNEEILSDRCLLLKELNDINSIDSLEAAQKSKVRWAIKAIRGTLVDGGWIVDLLAVKIMFLKYVSTQFSSPVSPCICFADQFTRLSLEQQTDLERNVSNEEIKRTVWDSGTNKSPGPDDFTFEFFRRYLKLLEHDIVADVK
ncbi:hypothetical protein Tco_0003522 [Tanacetum coccineum]